MTAHVQKDKVFNIGFFKAFAIVAGAFLVGCVTMAFSIGATLNRDHFTVVALAEEYRNIPATYQRKDTAELQFSYISSQLADIRTKMDKIEQKLGK